MDKLVEIKDNQVVVSSLQIAEKFDKQHRSILRLLSTKLCGANKDRLLRHFFKTTYQDATGKNNTMYLMDRDGFSFLVMGFTGEKADEWKLNFIDAFNQMEQTLKGKQDTITCGKKSKCLKHPLTYAAYDGWCEYEDMYIDIDNPEVRSAINCCQLTNDTINSLVNELKENSREWNCNQYKSFIETLLYFTLRLYRQADELALIRFKTITEKQHFNL